MNKYLFKKRSRSRTAIPPTQLLRVMKITYLLLTVLLFQANAETLAQRLTIKKASTSLRSIFTEINNQTGYSVIYSVKHIERMPAVSVSLADVPLERAMEQILTGLPLDFTIANKEIVIKEKRRPRVSSPSSIKETALEVIQQTVTGRVIDEQGNPLQGAAVRIKGTSQQASTDADGRFSFTNVDPSAIIVVSFVGYESKELPASVNLAAIALSPDVSDLDEVIVVGYGTVKKSDVTGSVVSLKASDLTPGANVNVQQLMQGRAAGVQISQKSGEPGSAMSVKIRGVSSISAGNEPLYVIDGMPVNDAPPVSGSGAAFVANPNQRNPLNSLNPADIESIEILKDASATAIYGARGANGVVLISTKKGASGALKVNYGANYGFQEVANSVRVLSGSEYHDVLNAIIDDGGGSASERVDDNYEADTDWQNLLFQRAQTQTHDLSFSGGANNNRFFVSLGYFGQEGVVQTSSVDRYTARINYDNTVSGKYGFGINLTTSYIKDRINSFGTGINEQSGALYSAIYYDPTSPIYAPDGSYYRSTFMTMDNPAALRDGQNANSDSYRTFGTIYGEYFVLPGLSIKAKLGGDVNNSQRNVFVAPFTTQGLPGGVASILTGTRNYYMAEGTVNFNKTIGDRHAINGVGGVTYERFGSYSFTGNGRGYALPDLGYDAIGSGEQALNVIGSGRAGTILASYLARVNYTLDNKYLITASFRADGSSRFGPNNRFGYFPSAALAWKAHEEDFLSDYSFINELKLRASYGSIGNQSIANFLYIPTFSIGGDAVFGDTRYTTINPSRNPNPDLKWEAAIQTDIGIDFAFFKNRIRGSVEYYNRKTTDLLLSLPQPLSSGFGNRTQNIGSMRNTGVDVQLSVGVLQGDGFNWGIDGNISFLKNKVVDLGPLNRIIQGGAGFINNASIIMPGRSISSYYGYEVLGVWQEGDDFSTTTDNVKPGDLKYRDVNGDGTITDVDRMILGKPLPDFTYGMANTFSYKNLSLMVYLEGSKGGSILNSMLVDSYFPISFRRNKVAEPYLNRWTPSNPTNEYPSFVNPTSQGQRQVNSRTVETADYLRLQSARLSYNLPVKVAFFNSLNVYVVGQNLFTITKYSGVDPAVNSIGGDVLKIDFAAYPFTRSYLMGINLEF